MKVLVTGATGFLGVHTVAVLNARGHEVHALGRDPARLSRLEAHTVLADLRNRAAMLGACEGMEAVIHTGALSAPWGPPADFEAINLSGTRHVLEGCALHGVKRLVHISSPAVVFDGLDQIDLPDDAPYPARHSSHYALTKKRAEEAVRASPVSAVILRPKAIYGPGDRSLLPRLVAAARVGRLWQIGDGRNLVELTYVSDAVNAILLALEASVPHDAAPYTVTGGRPVRLWEAIRTVLKGLGLSSRLPVLPLSVALPLASGLERIAGVTGREPRLTRYTVDLLVRTQTYDTTRARNDLGYAPQVSLEDGLERTLYAWRNA